MNTLISGIILLLRHVSRNRIVRSLRRWNERRRWQRELSELDDRILLDIGITREEALRGVLDRSSPSESRRDD